MGGYEGGCVGDISVELCGEYAGGRQLSLRGQVQIGLIGRWLSRAFHPGYERSH